MGYMVNYNSVLAAEVMAMGVGSCRLCDVGAGPGSARGGLPS